MLFIRIYANLSIGRRRQDKIASLEAKITSQNGSQFPIELDVTPRLNNAVNPGPSTVSPEDITSVEEQIVPFFDGDLMAFDAVDIDFNLFSDCGRPAHLTLIISILSIADHLEETRNLPTPLSEHVAPENSDTATLPISNDLLSSNTSADLDSDSSPITFPLTPDVNIEVPMLATLRAFMTTASLLNIVSNIFDPFALHTSPPTPHPSLPPNLHPVRAQILIPHHPALDIVPWPSVREKLICMREYHFLSPSPLFHPFC